VIETAGEGTMLRALLTLLIGAMLVFSVPTSSEACSYNCSNKKSKDLKFRLGEPSNSFAVGAGGNRLVLPITDSNKIGAVVLLPNSAGINSDYRDDYRRWGNLLLENGYAVLLVDHYSSRGVTSNSGKRRPVEKYTLIKDVADAVALIIKQPKIDKSRVFTLGFSLGAMTGGALAGKYSWVTDSVPKPRAVAGLYGGCYGFGAWLNSSADIPVLWLAGGKDTESPPIDCKMAVEDLKDKGLMTYHEYPNATHCWDCQSRSGYTRQAGNGNMVTYRYNAEVTKDSEQRVLNFFNSFQSQ
jgi:dienelactone hydrolase